MNYNGKERRSELSQSVRACMSTELAKHEEKEQEWLDQHKKDDAAWLSEHERKDIAAHDTVCDKLDSLASEQIKIKELINEVKSVWDGLGAVGKGVIWTAKVLGSLSVITGSIWAVVHFGHKP